MKGVVEAIEKCRSRGLKKDQIEELALAEKLIAHLEVRLCVCVCGGGMCVGFKHSPQQAIMV